MTRDEFVGELLACARELVSAMWSALPDEQRLRLAAIERELACASSPRAHPPSLDVKDV